MRAFGRVMLVAAAWLSAGCAADQRAALANLAFDTVATIGVLDGVPPSSSAASPTWKSMGKGGSTCWTAARPRFSLLDAAGAPLGSVTPRGAGPGELGGASALALGADGELRVMDARNGRIAAYRAGADGFAHVRAIPAEVVGNRLCRLGDGSYTQRITGDTSFHQLDDHGAVVRAFGCRATCRRDVPL